MPKEVVEILGYIGMALTLVSFLMRKVQWIRIINMCGASFLLVYGILTKTIPTAILNGSLVAINAVFLTLFLINRKRENGTFKEVEKEEEEDKEE